MNRLSATKAKSIRKPGMHRCDDTLYLRVKPNGRKSWVQRIVINGRRANLGLGPYPIVSMDDAREKAFNNRRKIHKGENPIAQKRRSSIPTFREAAKRYHATLVPTWRSKVHVKSWMQVVERHAFPKLGNIPVDEITQQDVLSVLRPIWEERNDTATRVRQRIRGTLKFCQAHEYITTNPAGEAIDAALPSLRKNNNNFRSLPPREFPDAVMTIKNGVSSLPVKLCLLFLAHTVARSKEALGAQWREVDLEAATWTIPESRMKGGKSHRVPLTQASLDLLELARPLRNDSDLIFPSSTEKTKPMTSATLKKHMVKLGLWDRTVVHGFRATFKTWATDETNAPGEMIEVAMSHKFGNSVEQTYYRGDGFDKRVELMQQWSDFLSE